MQTSPTNRLWELNFSARTVAEHAVDAITEDQAAPTFRWLETHVQTLDRRSLSALTNGHPEQFADTLMRELEIADSWLAFGLIEPSVDSITPAGLNVLFSQHAMITLEFGRSETLAKLRQTWRDDFQQFAQSPGFLLFEVSDHYTTVCQARVHGIDARIEAMQLRLFGDDAEDSVFGETSLLMQRLQEMRQCSVIAEETFEELATRSSAFISATTQPFVARNAVRMARLSAELLQQRDALVSALNLYIGMTGHRTGRLLKRLTAFSMIFLPLSFLAGVFGMNFQHMPELAWTYGYAGFWLIAALITATLLWFARRGNWF